jgi:hypothetical protein
VLIAAAQVMISNMDAILMEPAAREHLLAMSAECPGALKNVEACYKRRFAPMHDLSVLSPKRQGSSTRMHLRHLYLQSWFQVGGGIVEGSCRGIRRGVSSLSFYCAVLLVALTILMAWLDHSIQIDGGVQGYL